MNQLTLRRAHITALLGALALGALTAALATGAAAPGNVITIRGDSNAITIEGSRKRDTLTINGRAGSSGTPGQLTIEGMNAVVIDDTADEDCDGETDDERVSAYCGVGDRKELTIALGDGDDVLKAASSYDVLTVRGEGFGGDDKMSGSGLPDHFSGGPGDDILKGRDGDDTLKGNGGRDRCDGGSGDNEIKSCE